jgi:hypothetical protein
MAPLKKSLWTNKNDHGGLEFVLLWVFARR